MKILHMLALQSVVERLSDAAAPWQSLYSDNGVVSAAVNFAHVGGLLVGGGLAIAADRHTLRAVRGSADDRTRQLAELAGIHRTVIVSLVFVILSGIALFLADVKEFSESPVFWTKLGLVLLLLVNGALMTHAEGALGAPGGVVIGADGAARPATVAETGSWGRLRTHALASLALWIVTTLAGVILQSS